MDTKGVKFDSSKLFSIQVIIFYWSNFKGFKGEKISSKNFGALAKAISECKLKDSLKNIELLYSDLKNAEEAKSILADHGLSKIKVTRF